MCFTGLVRPPTVEARAAPFPAPEAALQDGTETVTAYELSVDGEGRKRCAGRSRRAMDPGEW